MTAKQFRIHILPNAAMLQEAKNDVRFERVSFSSKSNKNTEVGMLKKIKGLLQPTIASIAVIWKCVWFVKERSLEMTEALQRM